MIRSIAPSRTATWITNTPRPHGITRFHLRLHPHPVDVAPGQRCRRKDEFGVAVRRDLEILISRQLRSMAMMLIGRSRTATSTRSIRAWRKDEARRARCRTGPAIPDPVTHPRSPPGFHSRVRVQEGRSALSAGSVCGATQPHEESPPTTAETITGCDVGAFFFQPILPIAKGATKILELRTDALREEHSG